MNKILFLTLISLLGVLAGWAQTPVLHLKMDREGGWGEVSDETSNGNNAEMIGGVEFIPDRFGIPCRAVRFDGSTGYMTIPHDRSLNMGTHFTVTAWAKIPYGLTHQGLQWLTLVCKGEQPIETSVSPAFRAQLTSQTASVNTSSTKTIGVIRQGFPTDQWFHVALVYNGDKLITYIDGQEARRYQLRDPIYTNREPLNIGRDIPGNVEYYQGDMDDLKMFDKALSPYEVKQIYKDDRDRNLPTGCPTAPSPPVATAPPVADGPVPSTPPIGGGDVPDWGSMTPRPAPTTPPVASNPPARPVNPTPRPRIEPDPQPTAPSNTDTPILPPVTPETPEVAISDPVGDPPADDETFPDEPGFDPFPSEDTPDPTEPEIVDMPDTPVDSFDVLPPADPAPPYNFAGYAVNNLTLVLDVSGSMNRDDKLPLLKDAFLKMLPYMRAEDVISVITYSGGVEVVLDGVPATDAVKIERAIENLASSGTTKGRRAVKLAYRITKHNYIVGGNNRVILATDGNFDLPDLYPVAEDMLADGINLSVFSFGAQDRFKVEKMDEVASRGGGNHERINEANVEDALLKETQVLQIGQY